MFRFCWGYFLECKFFSCFYKKKTKKTKKQKKQNFSLFSFLLLSRFSSPPSLLSKHVHVDHFVSLEVQALCRLGLAVDGVAVELKAQEVSRGARLLRRRPRCLLPLPAAAAAAPAAAAAAAAAARRARGRAVSRSSSSSSSRGGSQRRGLVLFLEPPGRILNDFFPGQ